jgi:GNAT superfamily N-acetyltransferase
MIALVAAFGPRSPVRVRMPNLFASLESLCGKQGAGQLDRPADRANWVARGDSRAPATTTQTILSCVTWLTVGLGGIGDIERYPARSAKGRKRGGTMDDTAFPLPQWAPVAAVFILTGIAGLWAALSDKPTRRVAFFIFVCGPILFLSMFAASLIGLAPLVLRLVLLFAATFLPAMLYFLFISTRRESLFNAFTANLERLGLLRRWWTAGPDPRHADATLLRLEIPASRTRRIKSYLDRFGAIYGGLPDKFVTEFLDALDGDRTAQDNKIVEGGPSELKLEPTYDYNTVLPVLGATCLIGLGWIAALPPGVFEPYDPKKFGEWFEKIVTPTQSPVVFAFLGAYFFSLQMVIKRFVRRDLGANAYNAISLRIILAVIGVWVAIQCFGMLGTHPEKPEAYILVASFAVGAFPLIVWQLVSGALKKVPVFQWSLPSLTSSQPLDAIQGLSVWHQARLEEEDVENVPNLATADLVDLLLNTKIPAQRLVDWVDQAILLTYLGRIEAADGGANDGIRERRDRLQKFGIRTATALECAYSDFLTTQRRETATPKAGGANSTVPLFVGEEGDILRSIVVAMYRCPSFGLVRNWRGIADDYYIPALSPAMRADRSESSAARDGAPEASTSLPERPQAADQHAAEDPASPTVTAPTVKAPGDCAADELKLFCRLILEAGMVEEAGLDDLVKQAKALGFLRLGGQVVGIAGLKRPRDAYRERVFADAKSSHLATEFPYELGWVFVSERVRGKGHSTALIAAVMDKAGQENVFATTEASNTAMQCTLRRFGFDEAGEYLSARADRPERRLLLFLRYQPEDVPTRTKTVEEEKVGAS